MLAVSRHFGMLFHQFLDGGGLVVQFCLLVRVLLFQLGIGLRQVVYLLHHLLELAAVLGTKLGIGLEVVDLVLHFDDSAVIQVVVLERQLYLQTFDLLQ